MFPLRKYFLEEIEILVIMFPLRNWKYFLEEIEITVIMFPLRNWSDIDNASSKKFGLADTVTPIGVPRRKWFKENRIRKNDLLLCTVCDYCSSQPPFHCRLKQLVHHNMGKNWLLTFNVDKKQAIIITEHNLDYHHSLWLVALSKRLFALNVFWESSPPHTSIRTRIYYP